MNVPEFTMCSCAATGKVGYFPLDGVFLVETVWKGGVLGRERIESVYTRDMRIIGFEIMTWRVTN